MLDVRPLTEKLQAKAIAELNEVPSRIEDDVIAFRTWIEKQPHLKARTDDQFLLTFLRGCKFSLEKANEKFDKYYTLRTVYPELLTCRNVDDPKIQDIFKLGVGLLLPKPLGEDGPRIMIIRTGGYPTEKYTLAEVMRINAAIQDILLREDDNVVVSGYIQIMDCANVTPAHFFQLQPSIMKKFSTFAEEALPLRHHGSHFINTPSTFETVFNTIKPFMSPKMQERLYMHGNDLATLYKIVPKEYLPKEYGGENGSEQEIIDYWANKVLEYLDFFREDVQYGTDEKLRVGKRINFDSIFGAEGTFRKLDFD